MNMHLPLNVDPFLFKVMERRKHLWEPWLSSDPIQERGERAAPDREMSLLGARRHGRRPCSGRAPGLFWYLDRSYFK